MNQTTSAPKIQGFQYQNTVGNQINRNQRKYNTVEHTYDARPKYSELGSFRS